MAGMSPRMTFKEREQMRKMQELSEARLEMKKMEEISDFMKKMEESSEIRLKMKTMEEISDSRKREIIESPSFMYSSKKKNEEEESSDLAPHLKASMRIGALVGGEQAEKGSNFVFSPLSIHACLGLVFGLLDMEKQGSLLSFLGYTNLDDLNSSSAKLVEAVRPSENELLLKISFPNGIWIDQSLILDPSFMATAESVYKALIKRVDFRTQYRERRMEINDWIEKETSGHIKNFLPEISEEYKISSVIANALYFKGNWQYEFKSSLTTVEGFYILDGTIVKVPFMAMYSVFQFYSSFEGFKSLMLPYKQDDEGRQLSLVILLPNRRDGLLDLAEKIASDPTFINHHIAKTKVNVNFTRIPKFKISSKFEASHVLKELGLDIDTDLMKTYHGATFEVDEKGTTAAASTSRGRTASGSNTVSFIANHPFIFAIREEMSGAILFYGQVVNPSLN